MTSTTQDELYKEFLEVSGKQASNLDEMANSVAGLMVQMNSVQPVQPIPTLQPQAASSTPAAAGGTGSGGVGSTIESIASTVLKSGFGMVPLVGELLGLFGGGGSTPPPALVKYAMPAKLNFEGAETTSGMTNSDYDQSGMPRAYSTAPASGSGATSGSGGASPQITVNVQAMDARSFLDRSSDIAAAVRDAMLNLNSINDVVNDL
jgi:hypothetical protein